MDETLFTDTDRMRHKCSTLYFILLVNNLAFTLPSKEKYVTQNPMTNFSQDLENNFITMTDFFQMEKESNYNTTESMATQDQDILSTSATYEQPQVSFVFMAKQYLTYRVAIKIQRYWMPVIFFGGFIGNMLSLYVMTRPRNFCISCCVYLAAVAVLDTLMVLMAGYFWISTEFVKVKVGVPFQCKFFTWCFQAFSMTGTVLIMFMTLDRYLMTLHPILALTWCTTKRAKILVISSFVLCATYSFPFYLSSKITSGVCASYSASDSPFFKYLAFINVFLNSIFCFCLLTLLNLKILKFLKTKVTPGSNMLAMHPSGASGPTEQIHINMSAQQPLPQDTSNTTGNRHGNIGNQAPGLKNKTKREKQLSKLLPLISCMFLILTLPLYVRYIFYLNHNPHDSPRAFANYVFAYHLTHKLFYTNNAINFLLYVLAGSKFRDDIKRICKKR